MSQPLDRSIRLPQLGRLDEATGEFWREQVFDMGAGKDNLSAYEPNRMYLNLDGRNFLDCSFGSGCDIDADSRSVVAADFNRDGAPDLLVGSVGGGPLRMFANRFSTGHHSVRLDLIGTDSNRQAIGARVIVTAGERKIVRDLFPANGCLGQSPTEMLIGLGDASTIDKLEIRWPSGQQRVLRNVPVDGLVAITEGESKLQFTPFRQLQQEANANRPPGLNEYSSIDAPRFQSAASAEFRAEEKVLGLEFKGEKKAYPIRYMNSHHVCHDVISRTPVLISYCPPSRSGIAFDRHVGDAHREFTLNFDVAGMLKTAGYTVLRDRETSSIWNPVTGQCISGKLKGTQLRAVPLFTTTWGQWSQLNPSSDVLMPERSSYSTVPTDGSDSGSKFASKSVKAAFPADELGLGVWGPAMQIFFAFDLFEQSKLNIVACKLRDEPIVVFYNKQHQSARCYYAIGRNANVIAFAADKSSNGRFVAKDGSVFDMMGRCQEGPLAGTTLTPVAETTVARWYAWNLTFPKSIVIRPPKKTRAL